MMATQDRTRIYFRKIRRDLPDPLSPRSILANLLQVGCQKLGSLPIYFLIVHPLKPTSKLTDIGKKTVEFTIRSLLHYT